MKIFMRNNTLNRGRLSGWRHRIFVWMLSGGLLALGSTDALPPDEGTPVQIPSPLSLSDAFQLALHSNRDIRVASLEADVAETGIEKAEGEFDPELFAETGVSRTDRPPGAVSAGSAYFSDRDYSAGLRKRFVTGTEIELGVSTERERDISGGAGTNSEYDSSVSFTVRQDVLRECGTAINYAPILIAKNNSEISSEAFRHEVLQVLFNVERVYWRLFFALADLEVREQQLTRAEKLVERANAQVAVGEAAPIEIVRAQSSAAAQRVAIIEAGNQIDRLRRLLLETMGLVDRESVNAEFELSDRPATEKVSPSIGKALDVAMRKRPDIRQTRLALTNAEFTQMLAADRMLPDVEFVGELGRRGFDNSFSGSTEMMSGGDYESWGAGITFSWPLYRRALRADYRRAVKQTELNEARIARTRQSIAREVADALSDLRTSEARIGEAEVSVRLAEKLLQAEEKSFSLGRSDSLDVLTAQAALARAERDELAAQTDYAIALANFFRVQGNSPEAKGVDFDEGAVQQR